MNPLSIFLQAAGGGMDMSLIFLMFGVFLVMQFLIMGPRQKKKEKEQQNFVANLPAGSKLVTTGGIHGKLLRVEDDLLVVEIDGGVKIRLEKGSVNYDLTKKLNPTPATTDKK